MIHELEHDLLTVMVVKLKNCGCSLQKICEVMAGSVEDYETFVGMRFCTDCGKHFTGTKCPRCGREV